MANSLASGTTSIAGIMKVEKPHVKVSQSESAFTEGSTRWTNRDLDPVPPESRKWGVTSFLAYWISDGAFVLISTILLAPLLSRH